MSVNNMFYPKDKEFTKAEKRAFAREELVYNVTEDILVLIEDMGITLGMVEGCSWCDIDIEDLIMMLNEIQELNA